MDLHPYQKNAVEAIQGAMREGAKRILLVMPTGAGKTRTVHAATQGRDALWLVHRRELAHQSPGRAVTVQSLLDGNRPSADILIVDEAHHFVGSAAQWASVAQSYAYIIGATATPMRADGAAMGELFERLVVGAHYSELLAGGYLVPCKVKRPVTVADAESGLGAEPIESWQRWAAGRPGFAFFGRVDKAREFAFLTPKCGVITGDMPTEKRDETLERFRQGDLDVLASVQCLTEGTDVPRAEVAMVARGCDHEGAWLQMVGRVLRPFLGKTEALVIDLPGASWRFGLPLQDRTYSLEGKAIQASEKISLSQCLQCGACYPSVPECPECGFVRPKKEPRVRIWGVQLEDVATDALGQADLAKLQWRKRMEEDPEKRKEWLEKQINSTSMRAASVKFKALFGRWPTSEEGMDWKLFRDQKKPKNGKEPLKNKQKSRS